MSEQPLRPPAEAGEKINGGGDQALQLLLLRRQVADLERRVEQVAAGERQARNDLLDALASSQASAQEQARLHEELAARERTVTEIIASEARLRQELAQARALLQSSESRLAAATRPSGKKVIEAAFAARRTFAEAEQRRQAERLQAWQSATRPGPRGPRRRNRPAKLMEKALCRLGPPGVAAALAGSGLWNTAFRADATPSLKRASLMAYASARGNANPPLAAVFDQAWYLAANPEVAGARIPPLAHYLLYGDREGRSPHPLVDVRYYRNANRRELDATGLTVLQHFLFIGANEGRNPHPLFNVRHYAGQLSAPEDLAMNPLVHYLRTGWRRGLNPHPLFDNDGYLQRYPQAAESMMAPLLHYVTAGAQQGLDPHPLFSTHWYATAYPDVVAAGLLPLEHFADMSLADRRKPHPHFDVNYYLEQAPEAWSKGVNVLQHYLQTGALQGLSPNRAFDCFAFIERNPDALDGKRTPFEAWLSARQP